MNLEQYPPTQFQTFTSIIFFPLLSIIWFYSRFKLEIKKSDNHTRLATDCNEFESIEILKSISESFIVTLDQHKSNNNVVVIHRLKWQLQYKLFKHHLKQCYIYILMRFLKLLCTIKGNIWNEAIQWFIPITYHCCCLTSDRLKR